MADNSSNGHIGAFIAGALLGYAMTTLLAPQSGETLRERLKRKLSEHSLILSDVEVDELVARLEEDEEDFYL
ncbi:MAG: YtxH domain-containing protein [Muribaculaceae bacterium]|nr:YtxH domain-containing protein [Muribaculaceae bacterium]